MCIFLFYSVINISIFTRTFNLTVLVSFSHEKALQPPAIMLLELYVCLNLCNLQCTQYLFRVSREGKNPGLIPGARNVCSLASENVSWCITIIVSVCLGALDKCSKLASVALLTRDNFQSKPSSKRTYMCKIVRRAKQQVENTH